MHANLYSTDDTYPRASTNEVGFAHARDTVDLACLFEGRYLKIVKIQRDRQIIIEKNRASWTTRLVRSRLPMNMDI